MKNDEEAGGRSGGKAAKGTRQERLKLALRENLKRRKSQARGKSDFMSSSPVSDEVACEDQEGPGK